MEGDDFDLYDALNLSRDASAEDVRSAFRDLSRVYHPDKQAGLGGGSGGEGAFVRVHRAYRVLGDDVLRRFYDRYGLNGLRLAEALSDDEAEAGVAGGGGGGGAVSLPEDRLRELERRVQHLVSKHTELRAQRLLGLQGSFTLAAAAGPPGHHGALLRRRYRVHYSAMSHSVQVNLGEKLRLTAGCAMHVQGANGMGVGNLTLAAASQLSASTGLRASVSSAVGSSAPELSLALVRTLTPNLVVHQKCAWSAEGATMSFAAQPWLTRVLRGNLGLSFGEAPGVKLGLCRVRGASSGRLAGVSGGLLLHLRPGGGELGLVLKHKPDQGFSVKLEPSITSRGFTVQATCATAFRDGLTKLRWSLRLRQRHIQLRLALHRAGLRFVLPLDLWPESAGTVPPRELCLALVLWLLPPLGCRALCALWRALPPGEPSPPAGAAAAGAVPCAPGAPGAPPGPRPPEDATAAVESAAAAEAGQAEQDKAARQRRLVEREAARRRGEEAAQHGLEILCARYGAAGRVGASGTGPPAGVIDVTDCLMSKVRRSRLVISDTPKSSLLGFCDPRAGGADASRRVPLALFVRYRFGGAEHERTFGDTEPMLLP